jgi:hypothetical protein
VIVRASRSHDATVPVDSSALQMMHVSGRRSVSLFAGMPGCIAAERVFIEQAHVDLDERTRAGPRRGRSPGETGNEACPEPCPELGNSDLIQPAPTEREAS